MEHLQKIRESKGMSREELCVKADVKYLSLKAYETNQREPKVSVAKRLAAALESSVEELG